MKVTSKSDAYARRSEGMRSAEDNVDEQWYRGAVAFITKHARGSEEIFCDDLWKAGLEIPREARALGPVIMQCVRDGVLERSGRYRASTASNMTPKPVWRSLLYQGRRKHWYLVKRKDGAYVSNPYRSKKSGQWIVFWVTKRPKAKRYASRVEALEVGGGLKGCRVVSVRVHRITVRETPASRHAAAVCALLRSKPRGLTRTELRDAFARHGSVAGAIDLLLKQKRVVIERVKTKGRPSERIKLAERPKRHKQSMRERRKS